MRKLFFILAVIFATSMALTAQQPRPDEAKDIKGLTYRQTDEVRNALRLDHKQFDKVYKEYKKYNEAVFGSLSQHRQGPPPGMGHGNPGMGNGRPPMGHPGMGRPEAGISHRKVNPAEMQKMMVKQEEKLTKAMKKILKTPEAFEAWLGIRKHQLETVGPRHNHGRDRKHHQQH